MRFNIFLLLTISGAACSPVDSEPGVAAAAATAGRPTCTVGAAGVSGLPFAHGRTFRTLDDYLAHLETHAGPIDQPWWREIRPGVYEHVKRMPGAAREVATRGELMKRFCFSS